MDNNRENWKAVSRHLFDGNFGLERETMRIDERGALAQSAHPFASSGHISRDFSENQTEFITGIRQTPEAVCEELEQLHRRALRKLSAHPGGSEYLWPFSNPPQIFSDNDNPVAQFNGDSRWKTEYRKYLKEKYGSRLMLYSGVHVNFSFSEEFLQALYEQCCIGIEDRTSFVNHVYLDLNAWGTRYAWLVVYLTAASPVYHSSLTGGRDERVLTRSEAGDASGALGTTARPEKSDADGAPRASDESAGSGAIETSGASRASGTVVSRYASPRCGWDGYWNTFDPILDYSDLGSYVESILKYVESGALLYPAELYYPVRIKPMGRYSLDTLLHYGVNHIEFRTVDANPFEPTGVCVEDVRFLHLLILYLLFRPDRKFTEEEQKQALADMKTAALMDDGTILSNGLSVHDSAARALAEIQRFFLEREMGEADRTRVMKTLEYQKAKLVRGGRYADRVAADFAEDYQDLGLALAKKYAAELLG